MHGRLCRDLTIGRWRERSADFADIPPLIELVDPWAGVVSLVTTEAFARGAEIDAHRVKDAGCRTSRPTTPRCPRALLPRFRSTYSNCSDGHRVISPDYVAHCDRGALNADRAQWRR